MEFCSQMERRKRKKLLVVNRQVVPLEKMKQRTEKQTKRRKVLRNQVAAVVAVGSRHLVEEEGPIWMLKMYKNGEFDSPQSSGSEDYNSSASEESEGDD